MARKFITPLQDASLYHEFPLRNTGYDEIIEVGKSDQLTNEPIRSILQFDVTSISASMAAGTIPLNAQHFLNLRIANAANFVRNQTLEFYHLSESWDEGTGYLFQDLVNAQDGVSWIVKDNTQATWSVEGGTMGALITSYSFAWMPGDIRLDISTAVQSWISGTNNGLLIRIPAADELSSTVQSNVKFFSRNTHTIYPPTLETLWYSQTINTGGSCGLQLAGDEFEVMLPDVRKQYVTGSTNRIRVNARAIQPVKNFFDRFRFANDFYLQSGSMYSIVDDASSGVVIPFDSGSMLSADNTGSYFDLKIENMYINRTYRLLLQVPKAWGPEIIDTGHRFKVI